MSQDKIPKEQLNRLKKAFDIFDINGDGNITMQVEMYMFLHKLLLKK